MPVAFKLGHNFAIAKFLSFFSVRKIRLKLIFFCIFEVITILRLSH